MKKVLALVLAVVLAFGMTSIGFAAAGDRINNIKGIGYSYTGLGDGTADLDNIVVSHNQTYKIWLYAKDSGDANINAWVNGKNNVAAPSTMTLSNLTGVSAKITWKKGGEYFNAPELKYDAKAGTCYVELKSKKGITVTSDKDIEGTLNVTYKSGKLDDGIGIAGIVRNTDENTYDQDSVWVKKNQYIYAQEFIKAMEVNFENDEAIGYLTVFSGKKYYWLIESDIQTADEAIMAKYDTIENVYHSYYSSNVNVGSTYVKFDLDEKYYVYNQDGKYLGMSDEKVALASIYYLSTAKIEMGDAVASEAPASEAPTAPADGTQNPAGGGDDAPANANNNPGTGANGFVNVAVVAGLVALAAAGLTSKK